jgi:hypothetical protein
VPLGGPQADLFAVEVESSSRPGLKHTVRWLASGQWTCTCEGFGHREKCRHIDKVRSRVDYQDVRLAGGQL